MKVFLRILAMILLVVPVQQIARGLIAAFMGKGFDFSVFGLSNTVVIVGSIILMFLSLILFKISKTCDKSAK